jgi:hypothetical protein
MHSFIVCMRQQLTNRFFFITFEAQNGADETMDLFVNLTITLLL